MTDSAQEDLLTQATRLHQQGNLRQAEMLYRRLWNSQQDDNLAYLLGTLLLQKGEAEESAGYLSAVAERHPKSADLQNNLGVAYQMLKKIDLAAKAFQAAIKADEKYCQAYLNLGQLLTEAGHWQEAEQCYRVAVGLQPENEAVRWEWAQCLSALRRWEEASREWERLLGLLTPPQRLYEGNMQLAFAYAQQKRYVEAIIIYERLLEKSSPTAEFLSNLSYLYEHVGRIPEAIAFSEQALQITPDNAELYNNYGVALRAGHRLEDAERAFARACELQPNFALAEFNRGSLLLMQEQWSAGWQGYEVRLPLIAQSTPLAQLPVWKGEPIPGQRLVVYCDQGFGDAIQFIRFLPRLQTLSQATLLLQAPAELQELFQQSLPLWNLQSVEILSENEPLPRVDFAFPLMSAGHLLQLTKEDFSPQIPYLQTDSRASSGGFSAISLQGASSPQPLKIGLCWRGNAGQAQDHVRSLALSELSGLAELPQGEWFSLQVDATAEELSRWPVTLQDLGTRFTSFTQTAESLQTLDLVISVDTAVCHLAGALGLQVWTLLPHTPDWRWRLQGSDSLWYPTMKLYRQTCWGDWNSALASLQQDLATLAAANGASPRLLN